MGSDAVMQYLCCYHKRQPLAADLRCVFIIGTMRVMWMWLMSMAALVMTGSIIVVLDNTDHNHDDDQKDDELRHL